MYFLEQFQRFSRGIQPLENQQNCSRIYTKIFSTDFIFRQQENLVDNQKCQAGFRPLCNKILLWFACFQRKSSISTALCTLSTIAFLPTQRRIFQGRGNVWNSGGRGLLKVNILHLFRPKVLEADCPPPLPAYPVPTACCLLVAGGAQRSAKRFTNLPSDSRAWVKKGEHVWKEKKNTQDPIKILYLLHVLPFTCSPFFTL